MKDLSSIEVRIKGKVQGVFFRDFIKSFCDKHKIVGYVRNEKDKSLFIHAEHTKHILLKLIEQCNIGPQKSKISDIEINWMSPTGVYEDFKKITDLGEVINYVKSRLTDNETHDVLEGKKLKIPKHIAIIPEGTQQWANNRKLDHLKGYLVTNQAISELLPTFMDLKVRFLTILCFSSLDWKLPTQQLKLHIEVIEKWILSLLPILKQNRIKLTTFGRKDRIPKTFFEILNKVEKETKNNNKLILNLGIDISGHDEILQAINKLISSKLPTVDEKTLSKYMNNDEIPNPDLLIITGGRKSLNNFMCWKICNSFINFTDKNFPDYTPDDLKLAILEYSNTNC